MLITVAAVVTEEEGAAAAAASEETAEPDMEEVARPDLEAVEPDLTPAVTAAVTLEPVGKQPLSQHTTTRNITTNLNHRGSGRRNSCGRTTG